MTLSGRYARLFPHPIRPRTTLLITVLVALFAVPAYAQGEALSRQEQYDTAWLHVQRQAGLTAAAVRTGRLKDPLGTDVGGVDFVQIVGSDRRILASTIAAHGLAPTTDVWPSARAPLQNLRTCAPQPLGCVYVSALRVGPTPDSAVVYAAEHEPDGAGMGWLLAAEAAALIMLAAWTAWKVTGNALRPIEAIRTTLSTIDSTNLGGRVPEPPGNDEIVQLARTINGTLDRLEEARECSEQALTQQRRFTSDTSHELRTPLTGLRTLLEEAQLHPRTTQLPQLLRDALSDVDRLQTIISDLLLLAHVEGGTSPRRPIDLSDLVKEETLRRSDRLPVRLQLETGATVKACRIQMGRVLTNLLDNAQRHAAHVVQVEVRREGSVAVLAVSDDGTGIADADRERIFERFVRLDAARSRDQGGSGLGLAIARDIAHAHQGTLTAGSSDIGGARFVMRIPLAEN
ncbi:ATP-binding protein [Planotetraspora thailandica]|nr:HAMP domain-containing sensor histidine kinase [Planotetraspora thailandica]